MSTQETPQTRHYECVVKVCISDTQERRAHDIAEGIGWACLLLFNEYGWAVDKIENALAQALSNVEEGVT